jgi:hypothetical protein
VEKGVQSGPSAQLSGVQTARSGGGYAASDQVDLLPVNQSILKMRFLVKWPLGKGEDFTMKKSKFTEQQIAFFLASIVVISSLRPMV